jgi:hypothetical protein
MSESHSNLDIEFIASQFSILQWLPFVGLNALPSCSFAHLWDSGVLSLEDKARYHSDKQSGLANHRNYLGICSTPSTLDARQCLTLPFVSCEYRFYDAWKENCSSGSQFRGNMITSFFSSS